jgi:hypothetical protein
MKSFSICSIQKARRILTCATTFAKIRVKTIKKCFKQLVENASDAYLDRVIDKEIQFEEKHLIVVPTLVDQPTAALVKKLKSIEVDRYCYIFVLFDVVLFLYCFFTMCFLLVSYYYQCMSF